MQGKEFKYQKKDVPREYNVVTNKYISNHDSKVKTNDEIMKAEAARAYWKRNNFNPVSGEYYDQAKEDKFLAKRELQAQTHGQEFCKKLPISVQT